MMLTMSCTGQRSFRRLKLCGESADAPRAPPLQGGGERTEFAARSPSFHVVGHPVLGDGDRRFRGVPAVDAIVLAGAEMVVLAPLDRAAAQALGVDLHVLHRSADLSARGRPAGALGRACQ